MTNTPVRGRRPAETARRTRAAILAAALELFSFRGYDAVGVRDIAAVAGTTHGLIRHHFASKDGVWNAVVDSADAEFAAAMQPVLEAVATEQDATDALAVLVRGLVEASRRHPATVRLLLHEATESSERLTRILAAIKPLREAASGLLDALHRSGRLRHLDADAFFLLLLLAGTAPLALAGLTRAVLGEEPSAEAYARQHADRMVRTLLG